MSTGLPKASMRSILSRKRRAGKDATKFQFDIYVKKIHGLHSGPHLLKWTRGSKVVLTTPFYGEELSDEAVSIDQKISLICTLYRSKSIATTAGYDEKDTKLSLVASKGGKAVKKTVGKKHFNLAEFAGIPGSKAVTFELNSKVTVDVSIGCNFVHTDNEGNGSCSSGLSARSASSSEAEPDYEVGSGSDNEDNMVAVLSPTTPGSVDTSPWKPKSGISQGDENTAYKHKGTDASVPRLESAIKADQKQETPADLSAESTKISSKSPGASRERTHCLARETREKSRLESEANAHRLEVEGLQSRLQQAENLNKANEAAISELQQLLSQTKKNSQSAQRANEAVRVEQCEKLRLSLLQAEEKFAIDSVDHEKQVSRLRSSINILEDTKNELGRRVSSLEKEKKRLETRMVPDKELSAYKKSASDLAQLEKRFADTTGSLDIANKKNSDLEDRCRRLANDVHSLRKTVKDRERQSQQARASLNERSISNAHLEESYLALQKKFEKARSEWIAEANSKNDADIASRAEPPLPQNHLENEDEYRAPHETRPPSDSVRPRGCHCPDLATQESSFNMDEHSKHHTFVLKEDLDRREKEIVLLTKKCLEWKEKYLQACGNDATAEEGCTRVEETTNSPEVIIEEPTMPTDGPLAATVDDAEKKVSTNAKKIDFLLGATIEATATIQALKEALQQAFDREAEFDREIARLKTIVDEAIPRFEEAFTKDEKDRESATQQLEEWKARVTRAELTAVDEIRSKEDLKVYIRKLEMQLASVQENIAGTQKLHHATLFNLQNEFNMKKEELSTAKDRIVSLKAELEVKTIAEASLSTQIKELDIEVQIVKSQARHEVRIANEAARDMEALVGESTALKERYEDDISDLKAVVENLKKELQDSARQAATEMENIREKMSDGQRRRQEAVARVEQLENELEQKGATIILLKEELSKATADYQALSDSAAKAAREKVLALHDNKVLRESLEKEEATSEQYLEKVEELKGQAESFEKTISELKRNAQRNTLKESQKLIGVEKRLAESAEAEKKCKALLAEHENRISVIQDELQEALRANVNLNKRYQEGAAAQVSLQKRLTDANEALSLKAQSVAVVNKDKTNLQREIQTLQASANALQKTIAMLRGQLSESQSKLAACQATLAADASRTAAELAGSEFREQNYRKDILSRDEIIEDLRASLTTTVDEFGKELRMAKQMALESEKNAESRAAELKELKVNCSVLEDALDRTKIDLAFENAGVQGELLEALSREENYKIETKRLKRAVQDLDRSLEMAIAQVRQSEDERRRLLQDATPNVRTFRNFEDDNSKASSDLQAENTTGEKTEADHSVSSSSIRQLNMIEKITDSHIVERLVEAKLQLALVEEEKQQLEHLIHRIRKDDKRIERKVAQHAERMEIRLFEVSEQERSRSRLAHLFPSDDSVACIQTQRGERLQGRPLQIVHDQSSSAESENSKSAAKHDRATLQMIERKQPSDTINLHKDNAEDWKGARRSQPRSSSSGLELSGLERPVALAVRETPDDYLNRKFSLSATCLGLQMRRY